MMPTPAPGELRAQPAQFRSPARTAIAVFTAVIAACAIAATAKVLSFDTASVPRVIDQQSLTKQVTDAVTSIKSGTVTKLACPTAVVAEVGTTFDCHYSQGFNGGYATVKVLDSMGSLKIDVHG